MIKIKSQSGQSLIETLVALAMAVIIMSAIALTMITAINSGDFAKKQNLAAQYAQQKLESIKQDAKDGSAKLLAANYSTDEALDPGINNFKRHVDLSVNPNATAIQKCGDAVYVIVTVSWKDGKCNGAANCHNVVLNSCIVDSR